MYLVQTKGPFKNYVDKILTIFDYLTYLDVDIFYLIRGQNNHFVTTYPPHLVHVVFERPLRQIYLVLTCKNYLNKSYIRFREPYVRNINKYSDVKSITKFSYNSMYSKLVRIV